MCVCLCVYFLPIYSGRQACWTCQPVTQEEGHTGFLVHFPPAVIALMFLVRRIRPFLSLVDLIVESCALTIFNRSLLSGETSYSYRDSNPRPNVSEGFEVTN